MTAQDCVEYVRQMKLVDGTPEENVLWWQTYLYASGLQDDSTKELAEWLLNSWTPITMDDVTDSIVDMTDEEVKSDLDAFFGDWRRS